MKPRGVNLQYDHAAGQEQSLSGPVHCPESSFEVQKSPTVLVDTPMPGEASAEMRHGVWLRVTSLTSLNSLCKHLQVIQIVSEYSPLPATYIASGSPLPHV